MLVTLLKDRRDVGQLPYYGDLALVYLMYVFANIIDEYNIEANSVNLYQTAIETFQQTTKQTALVVISALRLSYIYTGEL